MRQLADRVPADVREDLAAAVHVLERFSPAVCGALYILQRATTDACWAAEVPASLDPAETAPATDEEMDALEVALGIDRGWAAAFHVAEVVDA